MNKNIVISIVAGMVLLVACVALGARLPGESFQAANEYTVQTDPRQISEQTSTDDTSAGSVFANDAAGESADSVASDVSSGAQAHTASPGVLRVVAPSSEWIASRLSPKTRSIITSNGVLI